MLKDEDSLVKDRPEPKCSDDGASSDKPIDPSSCENENGPSGSSKDV